MDIVGRSPWTARDPLVAPKPAAQPDASPGPGRPPR
jgi:hypothetical protein